MSSACVTFESAKALASEQRWITRRGSLKLDLGLCAVYAVLIVAGMYVNMASLAAFALAALVFFCLPLENILGQLLFLASFAMIFKMSPTSTSFMTYLMLYTAVLMLMRQPKLRVREFVCILLILATLLGGIVFAGELQILLVVKFFSAILLVMFFKLTDHRSQLSTYLIMMAVGLIVSSVVAYIWLDTSVLQGYITFDRVIEYTGYAFMLSDTVRFSGLNSDPNYYSVNLCIVISGLLVLVNYKRIKHPVVAYVMVVALVCFGFLTVSKSFILMLVLILVWVMILGLRQRRYGLAILLLIAGGVLVILAASGAVSSLNLLLDRLFQSDGSNDWSTGRLSIWEQYFSYLREHIPALLLGSGLGYEYIEFAAHNTYIELLASLGIVGTIVFFVLLVYLMKGERRIQRCGGNYLIAIVMLLMYMFLSMLTWVDLPFHLYLCYCFLNSDFQTNTPLIGGKIDD